MSDKHDQTAERDPARVRIEDPRSIRALAHPARLAIIEALTTGEELTATECADLTGLSPSATAYHLTFLERYGLVEPASARSDRRQRPWRATGRRTTVHIEPSTPAGASAAGALVAELIDATRSIAVDFAEHEHTEPEKWRGGLIASSDLWLTAEEFRRVTEELGAVLAPYLERGRGRRPAGSRHVKAMSVVVPSRRKRPAERANDGD